MSKNKDRIKAREEIIQAANRLKTQLHGTNNYSAKLFGPKHIQQAVCVVRHHGGVKDATLVKAGYNPRGKK